MSHEQLAVFASQAALGSASALPLGEADVLKGDDPLNDVLSAAAGIERGQQAFIVTAFREYPGLDIEARRWIHALRTGRQASMSAKVGLRTPWPLRLVTRLLGRLWREMTGHSRTREASPSRATQTAPGYVLTDESKLRIREAERKADDHAGFEVALRLAVVGGAGDEAQLRMVMREMQAGYTTLRTQHQTLVWADSEPYEALIQHMPPRADRRLLLSASELAALAHVPDDRTRPDGARVTRALVKPMLPRQSQTVADPLNPPAGLTPLGIVNRSSLEAISGLQGLSPEQWVERVVPADAEGMEVTGMPVFDLNKHAFISGRSGSGKSVLLEWLNYGIVKSGAGLVLIEPHGELVENLLRMLVAHCPERAQDIVVIDLTDPDYSVAFNPLDVATAAEIEPRVSQVMEMLTTEMELGGAPRARNLLPLALTAMMEANLHLPGGYKFTLLQLTDFLLDTDLRHAAMLFSTNATVLKNFAPDTGEYEKRQDKERSEIVAPLLNRFQRLELSSAFANVLAAPSNKLDFRKLLAEDKIILINTGGFGPNRDLGRFLGRLVLPIVLGAVPLHREDGTLRQVRVCIDEAPDLISGDGAAMRALAEARKFGLGLITACQYPTQFGKDSLDAFMANTSSKIAMPIDDVSQVGPMAKTLSEDGAELTANDIKSLPNYWAYANVLQSSGTKSGPFVFSTLPPAPLPDSTAFEQRVEAVREHSRHLVYNSSGDMNERRRTQTQDIKNMLLIQWEKADSGPSERSFKYLEDPQEAANDAGLAPDHESESAGFWDM